MQVLWRECEKYFDFNGEAIKNSQFDAASLRNILLYLNSYPIFIIFLK